MITSSRRHGLRRVAVIAPAAVLVLGLALTGCSRLGTEATHDVSGAGSATTSGAATPATPASSPGSAASDSSALTSISDDLDAAGTANQQADSNATAGDQAAATNDDQ